MKMSLAILLVVFDAHEYGCWVFVPLVDVIWQGCKKNALC
jgi:hypothetical protein